MIRLATYTAALNTPQTPSSCDNRYKQPQDFFNVSVNIRMTAVKLEGGGLWVSEGMTPKHLVVVKWRYGVGRSGGGLGKGACVVLPPPMWTS